MKEKIPEARVKLNKDLNIFKMLLEVNFNYPIVIMNNNKIEFFYVLIKI